MNGQRYRGRLAPSPTGRLHLGIARTALERKERADGIMPSLPQAKFGTAIEEKLEGLAGGRLVDQPDMHIDVADFRHVIDQCIPRSRGRPLGVDAADASVPEFREQHRADGGEHRAYLATQAAL